MRREAILFAGRVGHVVNIARSVKPSTSGELKITDVNRIYLQRDQLNVDVMGCGMQLLDTGTHDALLEAGQFVAPLKSAKDLKKRAQKRLTGRAAGSPMSN